MMVRIALAALNHLLAGEPWARERLRPFAGQHARVEAGPLRMVLAVDSGGLFATVDGTSSPTVVISLPADTPLRYLSDPASVFAAARLSGSADFAENLAFVFRNLRWDVEDDLARLVGDIAAHRLLRTGRTLAEWQKRAAGNVAASVVEYVTEEEALVASKRELAAFCGAVDGLRDDVARLEKRLARLS